MPEDLWKEVFNYGTPFVILATVIWGLIKFGKWASGIINAAIFDPKTGWLAAVNRTSRATETYLKNTEDRDRVQQELCQQHADNLQEIGNVLRGHLGISKKTLEGLEQFREEAADHEAHFSTTVTNAELANIKAGMRQACTGVKELCIQAVRQFPDHVTPEIAGIVTRNCDEILSTLEGEKK